MTQALDDMEQQGSNSPVPAARNSDKREKKISASEEVETHARISALTFVTPVPTPRESQTYNVPPSNESLEALPSAVSSSSPNNESNAQDATPEQVAIVSVTEQVASSNDSGSSALPSIDVRPLTTPVLESKDVSEMNNLTPIPQTEIASNSEQPVPEIGVTLQSQAAFEASTVDEQVAAVEIAAAAIVLDKIEAELELPPQQEASSEINTFVSDDVHASTSLHQVEIISQLISSSANDDASHQITLIESPAIAKDTVETLHFARSFEPLIFVKIRDTLSSKCSHILKQQALEAAIDLSRRATNVHSLINFGVFDEAVINAGDADDRVRILSMSLLIIITSHRQGRDHAYREDLISRTPTWLFDHIAAVRSNAAMLIEQLIRERPEPLLNAPSSAVAAPCHSLLAFLIQKIDNESSAATKLHLLNVIQRAIRLKDGRIIARFHKVIAVLRSLLLAAQQHNHDTSSGEDVFRLDRFKMMAAGCDCLAEIALDKADELEMTMQSTQTLLLDFLTHTEVLIRRAAAHALMQSSIRLQSKSLCIKNQGVVACMRAIAAENDATALAYMLKFLGNLIESPSARIQDGGAVTSEVFHSMVATRVAQFSSDRLVRQSAQILTSTLAEKKYD